MKPGRFITFEGPEGAGKSTQAARLRAFLLENGVEVVFAREPGGTKVGEAIRGVLQYNEAGEPPVPEAEVLLFEASRAQLVRQVFLPALERGAWVVSDRFADSTSAYQGYGRGFGVATLGEINRFATGGRMPDMTFLLDLDVAEGMRRVASRAEKVRYDRIEAEELAFHEKVRAGYLELAKAEPGRFRVIDASRGEDAVAEEIRRTVREAFFA
jgi:dTMP kinase